MAEALKQHKPKKKGNDRKRDPKDRRYFQRRHFFFFLFLWVHVNNVYVHVHTAEKRALGLSFHLLLLAELLSEPLPNNPPISSYRHVRNAQLVKQVLGSNSSPHVCLAEPLL